MRFQFFRRLLVIIPGAIFWSFICSGGAAVAAPCTAVSTTLAAGTSMDIGESIGETCAIVTLTDINWTNLVDVEFISGGEPSVLSDRVVFQNNPSGQATICFESDNPEGTALAGQCTPQTMPDLFPTPQEDNNIFSLNAVDAAGTVVARIDMFSEPESSTSGISDELNVVAFAVSASEGVTLRGIPEPSALLLLSFGLVTLFSCGKRRSV